MPVKRTRLPDGRIKTEVTEPFGDTEIHAVDALLSKAGYHILERKTTAARKKGARVKAERAQERDARIWEVAAPRLKAHSVAHTAAIVRRRLRLDMSVERIRKIIAEQRKKVGHT